MKLYVKPYWSIEGYIVFRTEVSFSQFSICAAILQFDLYCFRRRGAEEAVEAMQHVAAVLMIVGDGDVVAQLKKRVQSLHLENKVFFYAKKPYNVMMNYTHYADIGLTLDKPTSLNYKLSLPNKVFDYIHTSTAIVATNILEVANVVNKHQIGEIIENFSATTLAATLNSLLADPHRLKQYKSNCRIAAQIENWENETSVLKTIYPSIDQ